VACLHRLSPVGVGVLTSSWPLDGRCDARSYRVPRVTVCKYHCPRRQLQV